MEPTTTIKTTIKAFEPTTTKETTIKPKTIIEVNEVESDSDKASVVVNEPLQARILNNDQEMDKPFQVKILSNDWKMNKILSRKLPIQVS